MDALAFFLHYISLTFRTSSHMHAIHLDVQCLWTKINK